MTVSRSKAYDYFTYTLYDLTIIEIDGVYDFFYSNPVFKLPTEVINY